jgi:hypothetical protein
MVLPWIRLERAPVVETEPSRSRGGELRCPVGRVVVGQDHLDPAGIGEIRDPLERAHDRLLLVPGGDDDGHRRPLPAEPRPRRRLQLRLSIRAEQKREDHETDDEPRDVGGVTGITHAIRGPIAWSSWSRHGPETQTLNATHAIVSCPRARSAPSAAYPLADACAS